MKYVWAVRSLSDQQKNLFGLHTFWSLKAAVMKYSFYIQLKRMNSSTYRYEICNLVNIWATDKILTPLERYFQAECNSDVSFMIVGLGAARQVRPTFCWSVVYKTFNRKTDFYTYPIE